MSETNSRSNESLNYTKAGVNTLKEGAALDNILKWVKPTLAFRQNKFGAAKLDIGFFANVIEIGDNLGLALSTDGVGTKILIAQMMKKFDTVGIDCVAMNVNDIICVGAEPTSMLDYLAIQSVEHESFLEDIAKGLYEGAKIANVAISGGEMAQTKDIIKGVHDGYGFDLVGMGLGRVALDKVVGIW